MVPTPSLRSMPTAPYLSNAVPERSNASTSVVFAPIGSRATTRLPPKEEQSVISSLVHLYVLTSSHVITSVLASSFPSKLQHIISHHFTSFPSSEFHLTCSFIYRAISRLHLLDTSRLHLLDTCSTLARLLIARSSSLYVIRIYLLHDYMCFALRGLYLIHPALSQNNWLQAEF